MTVAFASVREFLLGEDLVKYNEIATQFVVPPYDSFEDAFKRCLGLWEVHPLYGQLSPESIANAFIATLQSTASTRETILEAKKQPVSETRDQLETAFMRYCVDDIADTVAKVRGDAAAALLATQ